MNAYVKKNHVALLLFTFLLVGCATVGTQTTDLNCTSSCSDIPQIYSGTAYDFCCMTKCGSVGSSFSTLDLPLSLIADTIILPVTIYKQITKGSICSVTEINNKVLSDPSNFVPMFGYPDIERNKEQKISDKKFVDEAIKNAGTAKKASKKYAEKGWGLLKSYDKAMYRFNQAWLLDKNNYKVFWGFAAISLKKGKTSESIVFYEKAIKLLDDEKQRKRLLVDAARSYAVYGEEIMNSNVDEANKYYGKAISLVNNSLTNKIPPYAPAFRVKALIYYKQGMYEKSWEVVKDARKIFADFYAPYDNDPFDEVFIRDLSNKMPK